MSPNEQKIPAEIVNLVQEAQRCRGYDLPRQFIITCSIIFEEILTELLREKGINIEKKIRGKNKNRKPTLGAIINEEDTRSYIPEEMLEIARTVNTIRVTGAHRTRTKDLPGSADYVYRQLLNFATSLLMAINIEENKTPPFPDCWGDLLTLIMGKEKEYREAAVKTMFYGPYAGNTVPTHTVFYMLLHYPEGIRAVFSQIFKHGPEIRFSELYKYTDEFGIARDEVIAIICFLRDLGFLHEGLTKELSDRKILINPIVHAEGLKFCAGYWEKLLGEKYLGIDPEP